MDVEKTLRDKNIKVTPQRKAILETLCRLNTVKSAQQLFQEVLKDLPQINFSTVYRNLSLLVEKDILCQIPTGDKMLYKLKKSDSHHHHIICKSCGASETIDFCPMKQIKKDIYNTGFIPTEHRFEIYGYCSKCRTTKVKKS